jgi:TIR domain
MVNKAVFISYVHEDSGAVSRIAEELRAKGVVVWLDSTDLTPGDRWKPKIRDAIRNGAFFMACFSSSYGERSSTYMNEELMLAVQELRLRHPTDRYFIPVSLDGSPIPDREIGPGETFRDIHYVDISKNWDAAMAQLLKAVYQSNYVADPVTTTIQAVKNARARWETDRSVSFFGEPEFTELRRAVQASGARDQLSSEDYGWMLLGALYDGNILPSLLPSLDDPAVLFATQFWLERRTPRGPRYRSAALLERCSVPGRDEMIEAALSESGFLRASELAEAIRSGTVIAFIEDPDLSYDLKPADEWDRRQRRYMIEFWEKIRDYYDRADRNP